MINQESMIENIAGWIAGIIGFFVTVIAAGIRYMWVLRDKDLERLSQALERKADIKDLDQLRLDVSALAEKTIERIDTFHRENRAKFDVFESRLTENLVVNARVSEQLGRYNAHVESERDHRTEINGHILYLRESIYEIRAAQKYGRRADDQKD